MIFDDEKGCIVKTESIEEDKELALLYGVFVDVMSAIMDVDRDTLFHDILACDEDGVISKSIVAAEIDEMTGGDDVCAAN